MPADAAFSGSAAGYVDGLPTAGLVAAATAAAGTLGGWRFLVDRPRTRRRAVAGVAEQPA